jgi:hypothetical protein
VTSKNKCIVDVVVVEVAEKACLRWIAEPICGGKRGLECRLVLIRTITVGKEYTSLLSVL